MNPHFRVEEKFWGEGRRSYKALRNSSSSFIKKDDVRSSILKKCNYKCVFCGSKSKLQIDHIVSVYQAFKDKRYIGILNSYINLQVLCEKCNCGKTPENCK